MANAYIQYGTDAGNSSMKSFDNYASSLAEDMRILYNWSENKFHQDLRNSEEYLLRTKSFQVAINLFIPMIDLEMKLKNFYCGLF